MFRTIASAFALVVLTATTPVFASDEILATAVVAADKVAESVATEAPLAVMGIEKPVTRGSLLPSLYVSLAGLNAYDAITTLKGVSQGAAEANGLMRGAAGSPAAMWAIKGGVTAGSILMAEKMWRSGRRVQAIGMMVASNAVMAVVGARNTSVLRNQR